MCGIRKVVSRFDFYDIITSYLKDVRGANTMMDQ